MGIHVEFSWHLAPLSRGVLGYLESPLGVAPGREPPQEVMFLIRNIACRVESSPWGWHVLSKVGDKSSPLF